MVSRAADYGGLMTRRARRSAVVALAAAPLVLGGCSALPFLTQEQECVS